MKNKLLLLISIFLPKITYDKRQSFKEKLLSVAEELGAWMFTGAIIFCIAYAIKIMLLV